MATRGSALSRAVGYFRTANLDEARVAFTLVGEVMKERLNPSTPSAGDIPKVKRHRRTKAEMAAAKPIPGE